MRWPSPGRRRRQLGTPAWLSAAALAAASGAWAQAQHVERVEVARVVVDVRVLDGRGRPVRGLRLDDFRVRIDGRPARIESVRWEGLEVGPAGRRGQAADGGVHRRPPPAGEPGQTVPAEADRRLTVLFFQTDLDESRATGLRLLLDRAAQVTDRAAAGDRFAVVSFDSHLRIWSDFEAAGPRLRDVLHRKVFFEAPPTVAAGPSPSLVAGLDRAAARRAASMEQALAVVARALEPITGAKALVLFAWGYGRIAGQRVVFEPALDEATERLRRSRVAVFALDVTDASHHTLEAGLRTVADATGGFYVRARELPDVAIARLESSLAGHYVLLVEKPEHRPGTHTIRVDLTRLRATVLARPSYTDAPRGPNGWTAGSGPRDPGAARPCRDSRHTTPRRP